MPDPVTSLLRKLHRRHIAVWPEEMRLGRPVYDALLARLAENTLTCHQTANALLILVRLRACGSDEEVFARILAALADPRRHIRTQAARLALGMIHEHHTEPAFTADTVLAALHHALEAGLEKEVAAGTRMLLRSWDRAYATPPSLPAEPAIRGSAESIAGWTPPPSSPEPELTATPSWSREAAPGSRLSTR